MPARVVAHRRLDVPFTGDEKAMLAAFLDRYRETMLWKLEGLTKEQAFRVTDNDTIGSISALYEQEIAHSREIVAGASLEDLGKDLGKVKPRSLRWIMVHMIEETARHAGHADILRELTDGAIGQ
jgi:hypothetical protein